MISTLTYVVYITPVNGKLYFMIKPLLIFDVHSQISQKQAIFQG